MSINFRNFFSIFSIFLNAELSLPMESKDVLAELEAEQNGESEEEC